LWHDVWLRDPLSRKFPHLVSFSKDDLVFVASIINLDFLHSHFHVPLLAGAFSQLHEMQGILVGLQETAGQDKWLAFGSAMTFMVSAAYKLIVGQHVVWPALKWISKTCCQSKDKVF
jgi:hypothetical protein